MRKEGGVTAQRVVDQVFVSLGHLFAALVRAAFVDSEIAVSLRFNALRQQHQRQLSEQRKGDESEVTALFSDFMQALGEGNLGARLPAEAPDVYRPIVEGLNAALGQIQEASFPARPAARPRRWTDRSQRLGR